MAKTRRVTANLPADLLDAALHVTGQRITETLVTGLRMLLRTRAYAKAMALRGKVDLKVDLDESRRRPRR